MAANIRGILSKAFPFISAALSVGGPLGVIASNAIGAVLNTKAPDATLDAVSSVIAGATPDQMIALKQAEMQVQQSMQQFGFGTVEEMLALDTQDRASARTLQEQTKSYAPPIIAGVLLAGFFGTLYVMAHGMVSSDAHDIMLTMIGVLGSGVTAVISYYFGSSAGSAAKTDILAKMNTGGKA